MRRQRMLISTMLGAIVFCCGATLAQEPVQDIDRKVHPNLAEAQNHVAQANKYIIVAQKDKQVRYGGTRGEGEAAFGGSKPRAETSC